MNTHRLVSLAIGGVLCTATACSLEVPDLNDPGLDTLESSPDAVKVGAACTGLLIGNRSNKAAPNGYVSQFGILGRESYNFDGSDPRYVGEMLAGTLQQGSPFGGNFWAFPYGNIRLANVILHAIDKLSSTELSDENKAGVRGFVNTIVALDLLEVINAHDTNGAVIDTDLPVVLPPAVQPLGAIVDKATVFAKIVELLDGAIPDLNAAGDAFPFVLSSGYSGFDTPETFITFNRAVRARVAVYLKDYATAKTALGESFIDDTVSAVPIDLNLGVYHVYSTKTGDATNGLIAKKIFGHPSLETDAQKNGTVVDVRFTKKVTHTAKPSGVTGTPLTSSLQFGGIYNSPESPVSLIRNEELILLKAEALWFGTPSDKVGAIAELNIVRTQAGGLVPLTVPPSDTAFVDELLYERRYSLMFEGHRWLDVRRFDRMTDLPLDDPSYERNVRYPIPLQECNGRPGDPACAKGSLDE